MKKTGLHSDIRRHVYADADLDTVGVCGYTVPHQAGRIWVVGDYTSRILGLCRDVSYIVRPRSVRDQHALLGTHGVETRD